MCCFVSDMMRPPRQAQRQDKSHIVQWNCNCVPIPPAPSSAQSGEAGCDLGVFTVCDPFREKRVVSVGSQ